MLAAIDMTETSGGSNLVTEDDRADSSGRRNACAIVVTVERRKPLPGGRVLVRVAASITPVELPGEGAFETAANIAVRLAFGRALDLVGAGLGVTPHLSDRYGVQRPVQGTVAAAVEAVSGALSAARFQWGDTGEGGECGFVANPSGVRPAEQQLGGNDRTHAGLGEECRSGRI